MSRQPRPWSVANTACRLLSILLLLHLSPCSCLTAAVVGAGEQGIIAAVELQNRGFNVTVFERESSVVPILNSVNISQDIYDYLSVTLLPSATFNGSGTLASLQAFANRYNQSVEPLPATSLQSAVYFDSLQGVIATPPTWTQYLASPAGQADLLQQLAKGLQLLQQLENFPPTPSGVLQSSIASSNQTYADWAAGINLPAFTDLCLGYQNAALSGPADEDLAAVKLNFDRSSVPGLIRSALLKAGVTRFSAAANATGANSLLNGTAPAESTAFYHLPSGVQALFNAVVQQENLNIQLNTSVSHVTGSGQVTLENGTQLQFDAVIVTVRPPNATQLLPQQLRSVFTNATTQLRDTWIFNATLLPNATLRQVLQGTFAGQVSVNGSLGPSTGYPTYILRLYEGSPYISAGGYVTSDVSQDSSTATAIAAMQQYGFQIEDTFAYRRFSYPSKVTAFPRQQTAQSVFLLGEAVSGIGLALATEYVPYQMQAWFGNATAGQT